MTKNCLNCNIILSRKIYPSGCVESLNEFNQRKFCSHICYTCFNVGKNHYLFKANGSKRKDGYIRYHDRGNRVYLHRKIIEDSIGRKLLDYEEVHHINNDPSDNRIENLMLVTSIDHLKLHAKLRERNEKGQFV